jgi:hypothetical protein
MADQQGRQAAGIAAGQSKITRAITGPFRGGEPGGVAVTSGALTPRSAALKARICTIPKLTVCLGGRSQGIS